MLREVVVHVDADPIARRKELGVNRAAKSGSG
jgi:hypothetical protein